MGGGGFIPSHTLSLSLLRSSMSSHFDLNTHSKKGSGGYLSSLAFYEQEGTREKERERERERERESDL